MTKKRKSTATSTPFSKRPRNDQYSLNDDGNDISSNGVHPRLDPTYGQRGAFPGLDGDGGDVELFYGPAEDGLEYLRMVRSEAKTVPNLLVALKTPTSNDLPAEDPGEGLYDHYNRGGYYEDGAYTAAPLPSTSTTHGFSNADTESEDLDPQEAYYASLSTLFLMFRSHLHSHPPSTPRDVLPLSQASTHAKWRHSLLHTRPTMMQLGNMRQETVMRGLRVLESVLTVKNLGMEGNGVGAWAWGLLGRCRGRGEMGSEDVGVLRDVGKRAVWVLRGLRGGRREGAAEEGAGGEVEVEVEGEEGVDEQEVEYVNMGGGAQVGEGEEGEGHDIDLLAGELDEGEELKDNPSTIDGIKPPSESQDVLTRAKQSLLYSLQAPTAPPPTTNMHSPPPTATPGNRLSNESHEIDHAAHVSEDTSAATLSTHARKDELDVYATLDMIITVVGEFYGQRDLLEGRDLWDELFVGARNIAHA